MAVQGYKVLTKSPDIINDETGGNRLPVCIIILLSLLQYFHTLCESSGQHRSGKLWSVL